MKPERQVYLLKTWTEEGQARLELQEPGQKPHYFRDVLELATYLGKDQD